MGFEVITGPNQLVTAVSTTGTVLQTIYNETTSLIISTLTMAGNLTSIPIKTDGVQILTATITPLSTTNKLLIRAVVPVCNSAAVNMVTGLFQDLTTSALAATVTANIANGISNASIVFNMTAATTGPTVFKLNVANLTGSVSTWTVNGNANPIATTLGGSMRATLVIEEIKV